MTPTTATIPQQAARLAEQANAKVIDFADLCWELGTQGERCDCAPGRHSREAVELAIAALVTLITAESLRLDWLLARHTERGSKLIGLGFYPDKQEQRRMIQMAIDAGTCVVDEVDAIEVRKVRLDEARDAALWRAHVAGAGSPQAPAPQAAEAGQVEAEPSEPEGWQPSAIAPQGLLDWLNRRRNESKSVCLIEPDDSVAQAWLDEFERLLDERKPDSYSRSRINFTMAINWENDSPRQTITVFQSAIKAVNARFEGVCYLAPATPGEAA